MGLAKPTPAVGQARPTPLAGRLDSEPAVTRPNLSQN
jgi:hypothetical protein